MEGFIAFLVVFGMLAVIGVAAQLFGADSRATYVDDWARDAAR